MEGRCLQHKHIDPTQVVTYYYYHTVLNTDSSTSEYRLTRTEKEGTGLLILQFLCHLGGFILFLTIGACPIMGIKI